jgi:hypothetical protein
VNRAVLSTCLLLAASRLEAQSLEVRAEQSRVTIGDPITLQITVRLPPGMELIDAAPHVLVPPPRGIRLLSADTLRARGNGILTGKVRVAFYRIGQQPVPTLGLLYRSAPGNPPDTLLHMPISVEITPILEAGNPPLRDIKPPKPVGGPAWGPLALLLAIVGAGFWWLRRRGALGGSAPVPLIAGGPTGPFDQALARLAALEAGVRASGNGVLPTFAGVAEIVRDCLVETGAIPHRGVTTPEVALTLPASYASADRGGRLMAMLTDADLVKFAKVRPDRPAAESHIARARALIEGWRDRSLQSAMADAGMEVADAVR